jgi:quercetin dioxygenase-like cupin family protein
MLVGLMHMPSGTGGAPHTHPNEQWTHVIKGTLVGEFDAPAWFIAPMRRRTRMLIS